MTSGAKLTKDYNYILFTLLIFTKGFFPGIPVGIPI